MTYLILMLFYFLSTCLVIHIFNTYFFEPSLHTLENQVMFYFLSITISVILPLWYCYFLDRVMLKQTLVLKKRQLSNFVIGT